MAKRQPEAIEKMFAAVRLGLWGTGVGDDTQKESANGEIWLAAASEAVRQGVTGLFCEGLKLLPKSSGVPETLLEKLSGECEKLERRSALVETVCTAHTAYFEKKGMHPVVQKGPAAARLYPKPLLRKSGDIDLYFPQGEFETSLSLARANGAEITLESDGSFCYRFHEVLIEHHPKLYDSASQFEKIAPQSPESHILILSTHILKHALGPGIGLKQICDYAVATRVLLPECDTALLAAELRKAGLWKWIGMLEGFICRYLGLREEELLSVKCGIRIRNPQPLLNIVLQGGEFGHDNPFRTLMASERRRKLNTALFFIRRLPFGLATAPREWRHTVTALLKGNLDH